MLNKKISTKNYKPSPIISNCLTLLDIMTGEDNVDQVDFWHIWDRVEVYYVIMQFYRDSRVIYKA